MPTSIADAVRKKLNELGGGFPPKANFKLGDALVNMGAGERAAAGATIYVATTGDDDEGDGSLAKPFATIGRALLATPKDQDGSPTFIELGPGSFKWPQGIGAYPNVWIVGDRQNPIKTWDGDFPALAPVAGSNTKAQADIGAFSDTISNLSHWVEFNYASTASVATSTSPNLVVSKSMIGLESVFKALHAITSSIEIDPGIYQASLGWCGFMGVTFKAAPSSFVTFFDVNVLLSVVFDMQAATLAASAAGYGSIKAQGLYFYQCQWSGFDLCFLEGSFPILSVGRDADVSFSELVWSGNAFSFSASGRLSVLAGDGVVTNTASGFALFQGAAAGQIVLGDVTNTGNIRSFAAMSEQSVLKTIGGTVTATCTSTCITLATGARGIGLEAACSGTLTTTAGGGNSQITVGGNAVATFASLPANDLAAGTPQGCFAT